MVNIDGSRGGDRDHAAELAGDWQTIFENDSDRVAVLGPSGTVMASNAAWRARWAPDDAGGGQPINYFDVLLATGRPSALLSATAISEVLDGERDEYHVDQDCQETEPPRWVTLHAYAWRHGAERWAIVRGRDVTDPSAAHEQATVLRTLLDDADIAAIVTNLSRRVVSWSEGARRLYGYTADQAIGERLEDLIAPTGDVAELGSERLDHHGRRTGRQRHRRQDGSTTAVDLSVRRLPDRTGDPSYLTFLATAAED